MILLISFFEVEKLYRNMADLIICKELIQTFILIGNY
jgi:hypothetical protein